MQKRLIITVQGFRYEIVLAKQRVYTISNQVPADIVIEQLQESPIKCQLIGQEVVVSSASKKLTIQENSSQAFAGGFFQLFSKQNYKFYEWQQIDYATISSHSTATVQIAEMYGREFVLEKQDNKWCVSYHNESGKVSTNEQQPKQSTDETVYLNNRAMNAQTIQLKDGDEVSWGNCQLKIFEKELWLSGITITETNLINCTKSRYQLFDEFPAYHRSPRMIHRDIQQKIVLNGPEPMPQKPTDQLLRTVIPPLVMIAVMFVITLIQPRGIYLLMMLATASITIVFSVRSFIKNRRAYRIALINRKERFQMYLTTKARELFALTEQKRLSSYYHYPNIATISEYIHTYHHRIYERTMAQPDFLSFRVGLGTVPSGLQIQYAPLEKNQTLDEVEQIGMLLYENYRVMKNMPLVTNLRSGAVGYVGPRRLVLPQIQLMVQQLACFHSYHDLQLIVMIPEGELKEWQWLQWLPHAQLTSLHARGLVYHQRSREHVLNNLYQLLKERQIQLKEEKKTDQAVVFKPHFIILLTDEEWVCDHSITEFFNSDVQELGCSLVYVKDQLTALPELVETVIEIKNRHNGELVLQQGRLTKQKIKLDQLTIDCDATARKLAALNHVQSLKNSLPDQLSFLEMYDVQDCASLNIVDRWANNAPRKTLAVPVGVSGPAKPVYLNIHEKAHGPHGLIAGTTGSGKSEWLQTYILSLAVHFHPHDVAFLLIDYKGGGMAHLFQELPHVLGAITNLDKMQSQRALVSIQAELKRRQRLFAEQQVNHIHFYEQRYKQGFVSEPLPHLIIIVDEFAEMKAEVPEFMDELVSVARIGRSLGIHLLLATQKPSGVISNQIWSNARFKIALKVAERQDSVEVLHTPDAAYLTQAGRAYLQVGHNEVYELFQSAWSGAQYQANAKQQVEDEQPFYRINELGQYEIFADDLSAFNGETSSMPSVTELEAVIDEIKTCARSCNIKPLARPWLPPLKTVISLLDIHPQTFETEWGRQHQELKAVIGLIDAPERQAQEIVELNFSKEGHVAFYGSPGYGKSTCLQTVAMDLARSHNPEQLHMYLLDFGTNGLTSLKTLPHVADWFALDESVKLKKWLKHMDDLVKLRKKLLRQYNVANIQLYELASQQKLARIMILIDHYEGVRSLELEELETLIVLLAREGSGVGIHLVLTASRQNSLRAHVFNNIKIQIPLTLIDEHEVRNIVGKVTVKNEDVPGRAYLKSDQVHTLQIALPTAGCDQLERLDALQKEGLRMRASWKGSLPIPIPLVPAELTLKEWSHMSCYQTALQAKQLPLGLEIEAVQTYALSFKDARQWIVFAERDRSLQMIFEHLIRVCQSVSTAVEWQGIDLSGTLHVDDERIITARTVADLQEWLQRWTAELSCRFDQSSGEHLPIVLLLNGLSKLNDLSAQLIEQISKLYIEGPKVGIYFIVGLSHAYFIRNHDLARKLKNEIEGAIVGMRIYDQAVLPKNSSSRETPLADDEIYIYMEHQWQKLKITKSH